MSLKTILLISFLSIMKVQAASYFINTINAGNNQYTGNACQYLSQATYIPYAISNSEFINQGVPLTEIDGYYTVDLSVSNIITPPGSYKIINQLIFQASMYSSLTNVQWSASNAQNPVSMIFYLQSPMLGFKSGVFSMTAVFLRTATQIYVNGYRYTANPSAPSSLIASWSRPYIGAAANQTINITTPCVYLPKTTGFSISFPISNSTIALGYYFNPLAYFDSMNCGMLINGIFPPTATCSVSGGTLTVKNFLPSQVTNSTFSIFLQNLRIPPPHLGPINMTWFDGNAVTVPFLKTVLNNTNTSGIFCLFGNFTYQPTRINQPSMVLNFSIIGNLKFPYMPGYYIKLKFVDDWIGTQPVNVSLLNKYNQYVETGTAVKVNGEYIYTLKTEFLMDAGIYVSLSGFSSPYVDKTYYVLSSFWTNNNLMIAQSSTNTITFTT